MTAADVARAGHEWANNAPPEFTRMFVPSFCGPADLWYARSTALKDGEELHRALRFTSDGMIALGREGLIAQLDALESQWGRP